MFKGTESNLSSHLIDQVNTYTINLMRVAAGLRRTVLTQLDELELDLTLKLQRITGKNDFSAARLRALIAQTRDTIATSFGDISQTNIAELRKVAEATIKHVATAINDAIHVPLISVATSPEKMKAIASKTLIQRADSAHWWKRQAADLRSRFAIQMRLGLYQSESVPDLIKRIRGTKAQGYTDGVMSIPRRQAETLVRTSAIAVANTARLNALAQNRDLLRGVQWVSTLDSRTSDICIALDGLLWELPDSGDAEDYGGYIAVKHDKQFPGPTAHFNCRSTQVPVLKSFDELKGENAWEFKSPPKDFDKVFQRKLRAKGFDKEEAAEIQADTRASMDGQVGVMQGFDGWLSGKSKEEQDAILGKREAALWRANKISLHDLTNQNNRPLAASEL